jgi:ubiquitin-like protein ATG12
MTSTPTNEKQSGGVSSTVAIPRPTSASKNDRETTLASMEETKDADGKIDQSFDDEKDVPEEPPQRKTKSEKIKVHLVAVGSAPILKKSKFLMNADDRFAVAIAFLRKVLKLSSGTGAVAASSLFLYVNAAFGPSPEERIGDLFDCFGTRGELVVHYSLQEAWG